MFSRQWEKAAVEYEKVLNKIPATGVEWWARVHLAVALDGLGRENEAREQMALAIGINPFFINVAFWEATSVEWKPRERIEEWLATFRRLGMPEE